MSSHRKNTQHVEPLGRINYAWKFSRKNGAVGFYQVHRSGLAIWEKPLSATLWLNDKRSVVHICVGCIFIKIKEIVMTLAHKEAVCVYHFPNHALSNSPLTIHLSCTAFNRIISSTTSFHHFSRFLESVTEKKILFLAQQPLDSRFIILILLFRLIWVQRIAAVTTH